MNSLLSRALEAASETKALLIGPGALTQTSALFKEQFGTARALIVADPNTYNAAGAAVTESLRQAGIPMDDALIYSDPDLHAEHSFVERLEHILANTTAIPMAVGAGSLNDITKLAAHRRCRPYMAVATAASMDGYTAFGASITYKGSKQTFTCPAPRAVLADIDVIAAAPPSLNASGYADLAAKITAGADWIVADALEIESIDATAWSLVQEHLQRWLAHPSGIQSGDPVAIANLVEGLMMGGFAMQWTKSSRCASGAEHQFSHLWDMQHHTHQDAAPSHGFKVGVATVAITRLYEQFLQYAPDQLDVETAIRAWPSWPELADYLSELYPIAEIRKKALEESESKYISPNQLRSQLDRLKLVWPDLKKRLFSQIVPSDQLQCMLKNAGAPTECEEIGIIRERMRNAHYEAAYIRRRFTVLDLCLRGRLLSPFLAKLYPS